MMMIINIHLSHYTYNVEPFSHMIIELARQLAAGVWSYLGWFCGDDVGRSARSAEVFLLGSSCSGWSSQLRQFTVVVSLHAVALIHGAHPQLMFTSPTKRRASRPENVGRRRDIFWPLWPFCGVLRHLKVQL